ncbi:MAG: AAA family ATPase [Lachnospiraceae bacterium]|nr:AAA family ATPase [Lachnospiraceae bacterium]
MGIYINPGNRGFAEIKTENYVDKSGLLGVLNRLVSTERRLSCVSRARRFGKSYAAQMIAAYYCTGCDSSMLFDDLEIAKDESYRKYINKYNVLYLDIAKFFALTDTENLSAYIQDSVKRELIKEYDYLDDDRSIDEMLSDVVEQSGKQFIAIIDEWDSPIRADKSTEETQHKYLEFLRMLFKSQITNTVFAGAYMTGILPIKKDGSQSAISEFKEYTMIRPQKFARYIGFLDDEVKDICRRNGCSYEKMKAWYDGYSFRDGEGSISVYNANSVMEAAYSEEFTSYWRQTSAVNGLRDYINMDFDGLGAAAEKLLAGLEIPVKVTTFENDLLSFKSADDVLTMMIHFGYLSYDEEKESARIPNNEIALEFADMIHGVTHKETIARVKESDELLKAMIAGDEAKTADIFQRIHMEESSMKYYNNEQALRAIIKLAMFTYRDHYIKMEELDTGLGYADIVYLPKKYENVPALVIELKYNDSAEGAIEQIRQRNYPDVIKDYGAEIVLVGVSYDKNDLTKKHSCVIERI